MSASVPAPVTVDPSAHRAGQRERGVNCRRVTDPRRAVGIYLRERGAARELAPSTIKNTRYVLLGFLETCPDDLTKINRTHVIRWVEAQGHLATSTLAYHLGIVRSFCRWLVITNRLVRDPTLTVKGPKRPRRRPRALSVDAVERLLDACTDTRTCLAIRLMLDGLRLSEVTGLQTADVDYERRTIHVYGKGDKHRAVPLTAATAAAARLYLAEHPATAGPLIRSFHDDRSPITPGRLGIVVTQVMRDAGVKDWNRDGKSPHALRHTAATDTLDAGATVAQVRDLLGHENIATTDLYIGPGELGPTREAMESRPYARRLRNARDAREGRTYPHPT